MDYVLTDLTEIYGTLGLQCGKLTRNKLICTVEVCKSSGITASRYIFMLQCWVKFHRLSVENSASSSVRMWLLIFPLSTRAAVCVFREVNRAAGLLWPGVHQGQPAWSVGGVWGGEGRCHTETALIKVWLLYSVPLGSRLGRITSLGRRLWDGHKHIGSFLVSSVESTPVEDKEKRKEAELRTGKSWATIYF